MRIDIEVFNYLLNYAVLCNLNAHLSIMGIVRQLEMMFLRKITYKL